MFKLHLGFCWVAVMIVSQLIDTHRARAQYTVYVQTPLDKTFVKTLQAVSKSTCTTLNG